MKGSALQPLLPPVVGRFFLLGDGGVPNGRQLNSASVGVCLEIYKNKNDVQATYQSAYFRTYD